MSQTKPKGTLKTEVIIGTAATKLSNAVKAIVEASQIPVKLQEQLTDYALKATDYEEKITGLQGEYGKRKAEMEFQLDMDFKTSKKSFADGFLRENGMIAVVVEEDQTIRNAYNDLKQKFDNELAAQVARATGAIRGQVENEKKLMEAEYRAKEAENKARIGQLEGQLDFANQQAKLWKESLDAEREAGVKRSANSTVHQTISPAGK